METKKRAKNIAEGILGIKLPKIKPQIEKKVINLDKPSFQHR